MPLDDPVKISRLRITNHSRRARRRLTVTAYVEWVLGAARTITAPYRRDRAGRRDRRAVRAATRGRSTSPVASAFLDLSGSPDGVDRRSQRSPRPQRDARPSRGARARRAALGPARRRAGPCGALQTTLLLAAGASTEVVVFLGQGASVDEARAVVQRYRAADLDGVLQRVTTRWDDILAAVQVKTPGPVVRPDAEPLAPVPGALLPGVGARRLLSGERRVRLPRSAAGRHGADRGGARHHAGADLPRCGATVSRGRRAALVASALGARRADAHLRRPGLARLRHGALHGGHGRHGPSSTSRSRSSRAPALADDSLEAYFEPTVSTQQASLFEHCARALDRSLAVGSHGLPLMGTGDWNDGMNRVGAKGRGESVWLGWFLHATLAEWAPIAAARGETERARAWRAHVEALGRALEASGWDGDWYRRAYLRRRQRRSAPPKTRSAASTRSRSRGPCSRAPPIRTAPCAP